MFELRLQASSMVYNYPLFCIYSLLLSKNLVKIVFFNVWWALCVWKSLFAWSMFYFIVYKVEITKVLCIVSWQQKISAMWPMITFWITHSLLTVKQPSVSIWQQLVPTSWKRSLLNHWKSDMVVETRYFIKLLLISNLAFGMLSFILNISSGKI